MTDLTETTRADRRPDRRDRRSPRRPTPVRNRNRSPREDPEVARKLLGRIDVTNAIVLPLLAFVSALIIGTLIIALSDVDKLGDGDFGGILQTIWDSYRALIEGAFGCSTGSARPSPRRRRCCSPAWRSPSASAPACSTSAAPGRC